MADHAGHEKCNCGTAGAASAQTQPSDEIVAKIVKAAVPQDYEAKFNLRIVPGRSLTGTLTERPPICQPRGNRPQGWGTGTTAIDPALLATLAKADKAVFAWLAQSTANTERFLANPVAAIREAGVELTRADEKSLSRAAAATDAIRQVPPGVKVAPLATSVFPNGRVGEIGTPRPGGNVDDFGCGPKRKKE